MPKPKGKKARKSFDELTDRERLAIDHYFTNGYSVKRALLAAGYAPTTAQAQHNVWGQVHVQAEIERRRQKQALKFEIKSDAVLDQLHKIAFASVPTPEEYREAGLTYEQQCALKEFTIDEYVEGRGEDAERVKKTKISFHDKIAALTLLCRHLGILNDKVKVELEGSVIEALQAGRKRLRAAEDEKGKK